MLLLPFLRMSQRDTVELGMMLCKLEYLQKTRTAVVSKEERTRDAAVRKLVIHK